MLKDQISDDEMQSILGIFDTLDVDGGGALSIEELQLGFQKAGLKAEADELIHAIHIVDDKLKSTDIVGQIHRPVFIQLMLLLNQCGGNFKTLRMFFGDEEELRESVSIHKEDPPSGPTRSSKLWSRLSESVRSFDLHSTEQVRRKMRILDKQQADEDWVKKTRELLHNLQHVDLERRMARFQAYLASHPKNEDTELEIESEHLEAEAFERQMFFLSQVKGMVQQKTWVENVIKIFDEAESAKDPEIQVKDIKTQKVWI